MADGDEPCGHNCPYSDIQSWLPSMREGPMVAAAVVVEAEVAAAE